MKRAEYVLIKFKQERAVWPKARWTAFYSKMKQTDMTLVSEFNVTAVTVGTYKVVNDNFRTPTPGLDELWKKFGLSSTKALLIHANGFEMLDYFDAMERRRGSEQVVPLTSEEAAVIKGKIGVCVGSRTAKN